MSIVQQFNDEMIGRAGIIRVFRKEKSKGRNKRKQITWCIKDRQKIKSTKQQERSHGEARVEQAERKKRERKREVKHSVKRKKQEKQSCTVAKQTHKNSETHATFPHF